jgi:hypothetical protein
MHCFTALSQLEAMLIRAAAQNAEALLHFGHPACVLSLCSCWAHTLYLNTHVCVHSVIDRLVALVLTALTSWLWSRRSQTASCNLTGE